MIGCDEYSWNNETRIVKTVDTLYFEKLPMKGIEAFEEVPLGNKTNKSFIVKRPSQTRGPISLHDDKGNLFIFRKLKVRILSTFFKVPQWEIFMEPELRFGLDLGRMADFPAFIASKSFDL